MRSSASSVLRSEGESGSERAANASATRPVGEGDERRRRPAEEEAQARVAEAARPPRLPERQRRERRPRERDRRQVLHVEEEVVGERLRRVGTAGGQPAGQVAKVAPHQVLVHEEPTPARERDRVPAEAEDDEGGEARQGDDVRQPAEIALPGEEGAEREREQHRRDRPLGEGRGAQPHECRRSIAAFSVAPPAEGVPEREGEEQHEQHVGPRHARVGEEGRGSGQERCGGEPGGSPEQIGAQGRRPPDERRAGERRRQPDRRLREAGGARERREPVVEDRLVGEQLAVEARP